MTAQLAPTPIFKGWDNNGFPLAFGFLTTYAAGTTTPQATYVDSTQTTQNQNPQQLNFRGEMPLWLNPLLAYKFLLTDVAGNIIPGWPVDNIQGAIGVASNIVPSQTNTFTIGTPTVTFANGYFGANGAAVFDPVSGNIGYYARTAAEISASVTPINFSYAPGSFQRYGMDGTGTVDSSTALSNACKCNADVFDSYPGGGTYIFASTVTLTKFPLTIRGQARQVPGDTAAPLNGTLFKSTISTAGAAIITATTAVFGIRIQNIGFSFTTNTTGQIAIRFQQDLRFSIIEGCAFTGGGSLSTTIGIQLDGGGTFTGAVVIRDNYFNGGLLVGLYIRGNSTTVKVVNNEFYGYGGAAGAVNGNGVEIDYPVVEPVLMGNYFEGWTYGIYSAGAASVRQIGNDYAVCTNAFNWVKTSYPNVRNQSVGDNLAGGAGLPIYSTTDADGNMVIGGTVGFFVAAQPLQSIRGFQEGAGAGTALRTYAVGYPQTVAFSAGNFTGNGSMTWVVSSGGQGTFLFAIVGKTLTVWFSITGTVGGTPNNELQIAIPGGFTAGAAVQELCEIINGGAGAVGQSQVSLNGAVINFFSSTAASPGNWTAGSASVIGRITIPVN